MQQMMHMAEVEHFLPFTLRFVKPIRILIKTYTKKTIYLFGRNLHWTGADPGGGWGG